MALNVIYLQGANSIVDYKGQPTHKSLASDVASATCFYHVHGKAAKPLLAGSVLAHEGLLVVVHDAHELGMAWLGRWLTWRKTFSGKTYRVILLSNQEPSEAVKSALKTLYVQVKESQLFFNLYVEALLALDSKAAMLYAKSVDEIQIPRVFSDLKIHLNTARLMNSAVRRNQDFKEIIPDIGSSYAQMRWLKSYIKYYPSTDCDRRNSLIQLLETTPYLGSLEYLALRWV